jgi:hypothetical protein
MSIRTKIAAQALTLLVVTGAVASIVQPVQAQGLYLDIGPMSGMFNGILGSALAANRAYYGTGSLHCPWVRTSDRYGNYNGRVRTCMLPPRISHGVLELRSRRLPG